MPETAWYDIVAIPALLRHARNTYGSAMRQALEDGGYGDIPKNGLYVVGGLALGEQRDVPLSELIRSLRISKQSAGQLVDTLVLRGYLERREDPQDRRRLVVGLTARGRAAATVQAAARERIDIRLADEIGDAQVAQLRRSLAALIGLDQEHDSVDDDA